MNILEEISQQITPTQVNDLSRQLGTTPEATEKAIGVALPLLIGGLSRNAQTPNGAAALAGALDRDHHADILGSLGGGAAGIGGLGGILGSILGDGPPARKALDGGGILEHIFGKKRTGVERGIEKTSGLDGAQVGKLLMILAPIVMASLGRMKKKKGLDQGGLRDVLGRQQREIETSTSGLPGGLGSLIDRDNDGQVADDIASIGIDLARNWMARR